MLSVVYVIFTEGSTATSGDDLIRPDLAHEAVRLARVLARLVPDEPEVHGLLAPARADRGAVPGPHRTRRRAGAAGGPGPATVGPGRDPARPGRARPGRAGGPRPGRLRAPGGDRRVPRRRAVGRGRPTGSGSWCSTRPSAGWRPRPSSSSTGRSPSRWRRGPAAALRVVDDLVAGGRARRLAPAAERAGRAADPPRPDRGGAVGAGARRRALRERPRAGRARAQAPRRSAEDRRRPSAATSPRSRQGRRARRPPHRWCAGDVRNPWPSGGDGGTVEQLQRP